MTRLGWRCLAQGKERRSRSPSGFNTALKVTEGIGETYT